MKLLIQLLILISSLTILAKTSHIVTNNSVKVARITGLGERTIGFILLSLASSSPEIAVAFSAIVSGNVGITLGNVFGTSVADILLVIGIMGLLAKIRIYKKTMKKLSTALFLTSLTPLLILVMPAYLRILGFVLISIFIIFSYFSVRERITFKEFMERRKKIKYSTILTLALSLFFLIISSRFLVDSSAFVAKILGVSEAVIGATIISIGAVLPELAIGIASVRQNYIGLALGNTIGSCVVHATILLGFILLAAPLLVDLTLYSTLITFTILSAVLFWFFSGRGEIDKVDGILLLFFYSIFLISILGVEIVV